MKCPHCEKELDLGDIPYRYMSSYMKSVSVATECCGKPVFCQPYMVFDVSKLETDEETDDWGNPYKI